MRQEEDVMCWQSDAPYGSAFHLAWQLIALAPLRLALEKAVQGQIRCKHLMYSSPLYCNQKFIFKIYAGMCLLTKRKTSRLLSQVTEYVRKRVFCFR